MNIGLIGTICGIIGALIGFISPVIKKAFQEHDWRKEAAATDISLQEQSQANRNNIEELKRNHKEDIDKLEEKLATLEESLSSTRDDLKDLYRYILQSDLKMYLRRYELAQKEGKEATMTTEEFTELQLSFAKYTRLGGNGVIAQMYEAVIRRLRLTTPVVSFDSKLTKLEEQIPDSSILDKNRKMAEEGFIPRFDEHISK